MSFGIYQQTGGSYDERGSLLTDRRSRKLIFQSKNELPQFLKLKEHVSVCMNPICQTIILLLDDKILSRLQPLHTLYMEVTRLCNPFFINYFFKKDTN